MSPSEILMVVFTAVIATTGVVGSIIFGQQLSAMKSQLAEMQSTGKQTEALVNATSDLAAAAGRSAKASEDGLLKLQRAFLSLNHIRYLSHVDDEGKVWWSVHMEWLNSGLSPAKKARFFSMKYSEDVAMPSDFSFAAPSGMAEMFVGPKAVISSGGFAVTSDELVGVRDGRKFLSFWGGAKYRDIFDDTPEHETRFLVRVTGYRGDVTRPWDEKSNIVELVMDVEPRHNCADEDCAVK
jgi:hypothetical protein